MSRVFSYCTCLVLVLIASTASANGHGRHHHRHASPVGGSSMGYGIGYGSGYGGYSGLSDFNGIPYYGYGYAYEPYRNGSFRAPDLLDEPYFRAQHKFDSQFPGRYLERPRLQLKSDVPVRRYP